jgi:hypothetical protein
MAAVGSQEIFGHVVDRWPVADLGGCGAFCASSAR